MGTATDPHSLPDSVMWCGQRGSRYGMSVSIEGAARWTAQLIMSATGELAGHRYPSNPSNAVVATICRSSPGRTA